MLLDIINIILGSELCGAAGAKPLHENLWQHGDLESRMPWPGPGVYAPLPPIPTFSQEHASPKTTEQTPRPTATSIFTNTSSVDNACNKVRKLQYSQTVNVPTSASIMYATVPAALAYECIKSVPFNARGAVELLDSIRPYLDWQTTLQYVKSPPVEYAEKVQAPYDFWSEWERVYSTAQSDGYSSEYEFGFDLYETFLKVHDGHFGIYTDSVAGVFTFYRTTPLVSVSIDGTSLPEVYAYEDILDTVTGNKSYTPSPLRYINGNNSTEYLLKWSQYNSLQDPDALWNNMFYLLQQMSLGYGGSSTGTFTGGGRGRFVYPGANTTLNFANGTSVTHENYALVGIPFDNIKSGTDLAKVFLTPPGVPHSAEELAVNFTSTTPLPAVTATPTPAPGFPKPVIRQAANLNSGYFLGGDGYDDVAVLSVAGFVAAAANEISFQEVNTYFLERAVAANKTKLIIDLSANGGGTILQGFDLFKQLFPHMEPYGAQRFKSHEAFDYVGQEISHFAGHLRRNPDILNRTAAEDVASPFNYRSDLDVDNNKFCDWQEKHGPQALGPDHDTYTPIVRWNFGDSLIPVNSGGIVISGYGNRTNITGPKFEPHNIILVTDGYCASTCTLFSELMRQQAGVKIINLGGRPNNAITQAIGGTKGANSMPFAYILNQVEFPFAYEYVHSKEFYNHTALGKYNDLWFYRSLATVVNGRDAFRLGDPSNVPLQFKYEPADCRIYYTPEMAVDMTATWKTIADTAFNGIDHCIAGSVDSPQGYGKRSSKPRKKHAVRRGLQAQEHRDAIGTVHTSNERIMNVGDGMMIP